MKDLILKEIEQGTTLVNLANVIGKTEKQVGALLRMLENDGYLFERTYSDKGDITYNFKTNFSDTPNRIITTSNSVRAVVLSDLHVGIDNNGLEVMPNIISYMKNNNIHLAFIIGDLFEGLVGRKKESRLDVKDQIQQFFKSFPYESGIIFFVLYGNHDFSIYQEEHFDVRKKVSIRPDMIDLGYGIGRIYLGNDLIGFKHELILSKPDKNLDDVKLIISGHSHRFDVHDNVIVSPALLNEPFYEDMLSCGFLDMTFKLDEESMIEELKIKHFVLLDTFKQASEIYMPFKTKVKKKI